ncbi:hypothetical protein PT974_04109 [Cladobotryum mycophilum]|uniref:CSD domain-containing protein n=1 Tax=Cladobotryum mycophilum TaxID=491253 RepID=A0ABR0SU89_9HYPO
MPRGTITAFSNDRGYGFIAQDDEREDPFLLASYTEFVGPDKKKKIEEGMRVEYDLGSDKGVATAVSIRFIEAKEAD